MATNTTPIPAKTPLAGRSRSVRSVAACAAADFFRSEMALAIPRASCLRILNRCKLRPPAFRPPRSGARSSSKSLRPATARRASAQPVAPPECRDPREGQQGNQQTPCQHAAGEFKRGQPRSDDVAHAQISGADVGSGEKRSASGDSRGHVGIRARPQQQFLAQMR